jgi:hypothetical protein
MIEDFFDDSGDGFEEVEHLINDDPASPFHDWNDPPMNPPGIYTIPNSEINIDQLLSGDNELSWDNSQINIFENLSHQFDFEIHGDPLFEIANFDAQDQPYSCAVATTSMIFNSFDLPFGEDVFSETFETLDIYDPESGTSPYFIDEAINAFSEVNGLDLNATEINGFNIEDLQNHLDAGDRLIIALDSYELYADEGMTLNEVLSIPDSGHAVQLTGIINSEDGSFAVINDPGFPDGAGVQIPIDRFMNACNDFDFTAISVNKHIG